MTTITVDTDGTTGDYSSLSAAVAALPDPFDDDYTIVCAASTGVKDTIGVELPSTGSYSLRIEAAEGHEAGPEWDDSKYCLETGDAVAIEWIGSFGVVNNYVIRGMQIRRTTTSANYQQTIIGRAVREGTQIVDSCIIRGPENDSYRARTMWIQNDDGYTPGPTVFRNCVIIDEGSSSPASSIVYSGTGGATASAGIFYNCTFVGSPNMRLVYAPSETVDMYRFVNNIVVDIGELGTDLGYSDSDYNAMSEDWDFGGANDRRNQTFGFTDAASGDYSLTEDDSGARDHGTDLSEDEDYAFDDDMLGNSRGATWDIGAFEYVSGGGADELTASDLTISSAVLDSPVLGQTHSLTATELLGGAAILESPLLGQAHSLSIAYMLLSAPLLDSPTLSRDDIETLTADDLTLSAPVLDSPSPGQTHVLTAGALTPAAPMVDSPELTQVHVLAVISITGASALLDSPSLWSGSEVYSEVRELATTWTTTVELATTWATVSEIATTWED